MRITTHTNELNFSSTLLPKNQWSNYIALKPLPSPLEDFSLQRQRTAFGGGTILACSWKCQCTAGYTAQRACQPASYTVTGQCISLTHLGTTIRPWPELVVFAAPDHNDAADPEMRCEKAYVSIRYISIYVYMRAYLCVMYVCVLYVRYHGIQKSQGGPTSSSLRMSIYIYLFLSLHSANSSTMVTITCNKMYTRCFHSSK